MVFRVILSATTMSLYAIISDKQSTAACGPIWGLPGFPTSLPNLIFILIFLYSSVQNSAIN